MFAPAVETTVAFLSRAEPSLTAQSSRATQQIEWIIDPAFLRQASFDSILSIDVATKSAPPVELTKADALVAQLRMFEAFGADWDGNGAAKPSSSSIADARLFTRSLLPESTMPRATLHANGNVLLFIDDHDAYVEIEFFGQQRAGFYARRGGNEWGDDFSLDGLKLPRGLSQVGLAT